MHRNQPDASAGNHISGNGAVDPAGEQGNRHAVGTDRHTAGPRNRICMHIGCKITYFHIDRQFRVMNVNRCIGICLLQFPANILAELNARHREGFITALALHLKALCILHFFFQAADGKLCYRVLILLTG